MLPCSDFCTPVHKSVSFQTPFCVNQNRKNAQIPLFLPTFGVEMYENSVKKYIISCESVPASVWISTESSDYCLVEKSVT